MLLVLWLYLYNFSASQVYFRHWYLETSQENTKNGNVSQITRSCITEVLRVTFIQIYQKIQMDHWRSRWTVSGKINQIIYVYPSFCSHDLGKVHTNANSALPLLFQFREKDKRYISAWYWISHCPGFIFAVSILLN